jgi:hypothetical protein
MTASEIIPPAAKPTKLPMAVLFSVLPLLSVNPLTTVGFGLAAA